MRRHLERTRQRQPRGLGGFAQCVQLRQPTDVVDQRFVLSGLRCDGVDLIESEFEQVRFLGEFPRPLLAVDQITAGGQPLVSHGAVALQWPLDVSEPIQGRALFVRSHQPQLIVLSVQGEQLVGEAAQRSRRYAAPAEVGTRRPVAADRTGGDDASVVVALRARGLKELVNLRSDALSEFGCGETTFDDRSIGTGAHPGSVGARTAQQVQAGDDHRLAGAGFAGQHGQPAVKLGGCRADGSQRLDTDLG